MVELMARAMDGASATGSVSTDVRAGEPAVKRMATVRCYPMIVYPHTARRWRDTMAFERQRPLRPSNINRLRAEMESGRFVDGTPLYIAALPDGGKRLLNGNHTCEAIDESGCPQVLTIIEKAVRDLDEAGEIYAVLDTQKTRTWGDSLRAILVDSDVWTQRAVSGVNVIAQDFGLLARSKSLSRPEIIHKYRTEYNEAATAYVDAVKGATPMGGAKFVKRSAIIGMGLYTFRYQPSFAAEFWNRFATNPQLNFDAPEYALLSYLYGLKTTAGGTSMKLQAQAVANAWTAAFFGETREMLHPAATKTFRVAGTPLHDGFKKD